MKLIFATCLFLLCSCRGCILDPDPFAAAEYETYAGDKFVVVHEGELGQYYADTVQVLSRYYTYKLEE